MNNEELFEYLQSLDTLIDFSHGEDVSVYDLVDNDKIRFHKNEIILDNINVQIQPLFFTSHRFNEIKYPVKGVRVLSFYECSNITKKATDVFIDKNFTTVALSRSRIDDNTFRITARHYRCYNSYLNAGMQVFSNAGAVDSIFLHDTNINGRNLKDISEHVNWLRLKMTNIDSFEFLPKKMIQFMFESHDHDMKIKKVLNLVLCDGPISISSNAKCVQLISPFIDGNDIYAAAAALIENNFESCAEL